MTALCNINPTEEMGPADILQAMEKTTIQIAEKFQVPKKESVAQKTILPPAHRRKLFRKRSKLQTTLAKLPHLKDELEPAIIMIDREIQDSYKAQQVLTEKKAVEAIKTNSKAFFKYAQSKRNGKTKIGPLKTITPGSTPTKPHYVQDPQKMADILSQQYQSVFTKPLEHLRVNNPHSFFSSNLPTEIEISSFMRQT